MIIIKIPQMQRTLWKATHCFKFTLRTHFMFALHFTVYNHFQIHFATKETKAQRINTFYSEWLA